MPTPFETPGAFSWCELMTTDPAAAKKFYKDLFGWELEDMTMPGMTYTVVKVEGKGIGGIIHINDLSKAGLFVQRRPGGTGILVCQRFKTRQEYLSHDGEKKCVFFSRISMDSMTNSDYFESDYADPRGRPKHSTTHPPCRVT